MDTATSDGCQCTSQLQTFRASGACHCHDLMRIGELSSTTKDPTIGCVQEYKIYLKKGCGSLIGFNCDQWIDLGGFPPFTHLSSLGHAFSSAHVSQCYKAHIALLDVSRPMDRVRDMASLLHNANIESPFGILL